MRWNCPHCEELVTAGIDFENMQKAYVRCGKCNGLALIHRSPAFADQKAKAAEITAPVAQATSAPMLASPPPPNAEMSLAGNTPEPPRPTRAAFVPSFEAIETATISAPPIFTYAKPPAFLMKPDSPAVAIETPKTIESTSSLRPMIALWIAAAIAVASGAYLYREGKKALSPPPAPAIEADEIRSANSAARTESRKLVIIRVSAATLRNGPSIDAPSLQVLERSSVAKIIEEKEGWFKIESPKITTTTQSAWVRADLVTPLPN